MIKVLAVKEWFVRKNGLCNLYVSSVLEVREKAVKVAMVDGQFTRTYWCPKSCLEIVADEYANDNVYVNVEEATLEEAIEMNRCSVSYDELVKMNRDEYNFYAR